MIYQQVIRIL